MGLTIYNIVKWTKMFMGKSVMHVNQNLGKCLSTTEVRGYYNNLTEKVTMQPELLETDGLPLYSLPSGEKVVFPVDVFQYGLGAYDLWLMTKDERYKTKFQQCCQWTLQNQEDSGAWCNFFFCYPDNPYGAMCQGEACSLLVRGYQEYGEDRYLDAARKAIDYMLLDVSKGGNTMYEGDDVILLEYTHLPVVLNGWIFAWWGVYDFVTITNDNGRYRQLLDKSEESLRRNLHRFDCSYWSLYDFSKMMTSPFYHRLHIAQMQAMYQLTGHSEYKSMCEKWEKNAGCFVDKYRALIKKAWQKIIEKEQWSK